VTEKQNREDLIAKRNLLFQRLLNSPKSIHLAIEIKALDDQIAEYTQRMRADEKKQNKEKRKMLDLAKTPPRVEPEAEWRGRIQCSLEPPTCDSRFRRP
jgi:hypothetical protein